MLIRVRALILQPAIVLLALWILVLLSLPNTIAIVTEYLAFALLGVIGAIFANATGAGGGVVFIPAFDQLQFSVAQSVATSFGIQCMGMTTGAIAWTRYWRNIDTEIDRRNWSAYVPTITLVSVTSVLGMWLVYGLNVSAPGPIKEMFAVFSIILGIAILYVSFREPQSQYRQNLEDRDFLMLPLLGLVGGAITAWLSVGVGEILAIYLILRGFNAVAAVAAAVVVSAITVLAGVWEHLLFSPNLYWQVVLFAGPGAIVGAWLARRLACYLPVMQLKRLFALWILAMGLGSFF